MPFTRNNYNALAEALAATRPHLPARSTKLQRAQYEVWHETRGHIMAVLQADNPRFDRERFIATTETSKETR